MSDRRVTMTVEVDREVYHFFVSPGPFGVTGGFEALERLGLVWAMVEGSSPPRYQTELESIERAFYLAEYLGELAQVYSEDPAMRSLDWRLIIRRARRVSEGLLAVCGRIFAQSAGGLL